MCEIYGVELMLRKKKKKSDTNVMESVAHKKQSNSD